MELQLDVIAVLLVFIGFCIGSVILIKKSNEEISKQNSANDELAQTDKTTKNNK